MRLRLAADVAGGQAHLVAASAGQDLLDPAIASFLSGFETALLLAQNGPVRVVMEILGHSQIALTMNTYSHVAPEVSREAADRMARMLWQTVEDDGAEVPEDDPE